MADISSLKCGDKFIPSTSGHVERDYLLIAKEKLASGESFSETGACWPHKKGRKSQKVYLLISIMRSETSLTYCCA